MAGEPSQHGSKRQKKLANEEKENVLRDSAKVNLATEARIQRIVPWEDGAKQVDLDSDLISVSLTAMLTTQESDLFRVQDVFGIFAYIEVICTCRTCSDSRRVSGVSSRQHGKGYRPS